MTAGDGQPGLPPFQLEVARMFFALPAKAALERLDDHSGRVGDAG